MNFKSINFYLFYIIFFNLFEKFFFFFKINNEFLSYFLKCKITFFLDPLGKHSFLSSINFFFLQRLFYSFPKWKKVLYIRRINRSISKRKQEEHTSELQSPKDNVSRLLIEKKKNNIINTTHITTTKPIHYTKKITITK